MIQSRIVRCASIFKFIFIEHVFKGKPLKSVIKRIKIKDKSSLRSDKIPARLSSDDEMFTSPLGMMHQNTINTIESSSEGVVSRKFSSSSLE